MKINDSLNNNVNTGGRNKAVYHRSPARTAPTSPAIIHPGLYLVRRFPVGAEKGPARMPVGRMDKFQCHDGNLVLWRPKVGKNLRKDL